MKVFLLSMAAIVAKIYELREERARVACWHPHGGRSTALRLKVLDHLIRCLAEQYACARREYN